MLYSSFTKCDDRNGAKLSSNKNQDAIVKCMWQQKVSSLNSPLMFESPVYILTQRFVVFFLLQQLFDGLCSISHDELLLLRTFENTHLYNCQTVKATSSSFLASIEKFLPVFCNSKVQFLSFISYILDTVLLLF